MAGLAAGELHQFKRNQALALMDIAQTAIYFVAF
jgi:hypothetical protein